MKLSLIKLVKKIPAKCRKLKNYYNLYGIDGLKTKIQVKLGRYHYPSLPLPEWQKDVPIFIISFNRLECLKKLIAFLKERNMLNQTVVIDNSSTFPPLIEYLDGLDCRVVRLKKNLGHLALWKCHLFDEIINNRTFVLTDCDVVPMEEIPEDFLQVMYQKLCENPDLTKIGLSLFLDDIPQYNKNRESVITWEQQFWKNRMPTDPSLFSASVDTTFAIYRPNVPPSLEEWWKSARMDKPYTARHLGWYYDPDHLTDEDIWYMHRVRGDSSSMFGKDYWKKTVVR